MDKKVEIDYKELYLQERFNSLQIELNMINMRATAIMNELPTIEEQLKVYKAITNVSKDTGSDTNKT